MPSTSCEYERVFSIGRRTILDNRNSLSGPTIEALQLQKNWLRNGVVTSHLTELSSLINRLDDAYLELETQVAVPTESTEQLRVGLRAVGRQIVMITTYEP